MAKLIRRNDLNETSMTHMNFTDPAWALAGSPCFGLCFEF